MTAVSSPTWRWVTTTKRSGIVFPLARSVHFNSGKGFGALIPPLRQFVLKMPDLGGSEFHNASAVVFHPGTPLKRTQPFEMPHSAVATMSATQSCPANPFGQMTWSQKVNQRRPLFPGQQNPFAPAKDTRQPKLEMLRRVNAIKRGLAISSVVLPGVAQTVSLR